MRTEIIRILFEAIKTTGDLARKKKQNAVKWYNVLARLGTAIDGLMGSADFNETERKLRELEEYVGIREPRQTDPPRRRSKKGLPEPVPGAQ